MMRLCIILFAFVYLGEAQTTENDVEVPVTNRVDLPVTGLTLDEQRTEITNRVTLVKNVLLTKLTKLFKRVLKSESGSKTLEHVYIETHTILVDKGFSEVIHFVSNEIKEIVQDPVAPRIFASLLNTAYKLYVLDEASTTHLHYLLTDIHDIMRARHNLEKAYHIVHTGCLDIMNNPEKREMVTMLLNGLSEQQHPGSSGLQLTRLSKEIAELYPNENSNF